MDEFERRLASRLAAYEESVPAPTAPDERAAAARSPRSRPSRWMLLVPAAAVVVAGVAFGLAGSGLLGGLRPVGYAPVTSLEWTTHPFVLGARAMDMTALGDRLIATGSLNDLPAAWYSDDRGETWRPSNVEPARGDPNGALTGMTHALSKVVERDGVLVALDAYSSAAASLSSIASPDENVRTLAWTSHDNGATWTASAGIQGSAAVLTATPHGFAALGMDSTRGFVRAWTSTDSAAWIEAEVNGIEANSILTDAAFAGSQVFLTGSVSSVDQTRGEPLPMIWQSSDGLHWAATRLGQEGTGNPHQVVSGPSGPVVVGGAISAGSQDATQRPVVWMRSGGGAWSETFLPSGSFDARVAAATNVASSRLGTLVGVRRFATDNSPTDQLWFIPAGRPDHIGEQGLRRQIAAVAALPDRFVVLSQCDANGDCDAPTVSIGIPDDRGQAASPTPSFSTPSEIPVGGVREPITRQNLAAARNGYAGGLLEPGWLPNGFVLVYAEYNQQGGDLDSVDLRYEADGHYLHVWQTHASPEALGQKDPVAKGEPMPGTRWNSYPLPAEQAGGDGVVEYSARLDDERTVSIDSDLDQDTMRHVLDSVYLHGPAESSPATRSPQPSLAPTPRPLPLSRDAAIEAARAFAGVDVKSARLGLYQDLHLTPITSSSPVPPSQLVWRVDYDYRYPDGSSQVVIVDAYSGQLIETTGVVN